MDLFLKSKNKKTREKRVGRSGKRGTSSGRGTKGQTSRSGHRIRPAERDLLIRIPKLRGYKNKSFKVKQNIINIGDIETMKENFFSFKELGNVKILGEGEIKKAVNITGLSVSKKAKEKIEKAGGKIIPSTSDKK